MLRCSEQTSRGKKRQENWSQNSSQPEEGAGKRESSVPLSLS